MKLLNRSHLLLIIQLVLSFLLVGRALSHAYTMVASPAFNPDIPTSENGPVDYEYVFWGSSGGLFTEGGKEGGGVDCDLWAITIQNGTVGTVVVRNNGAVEHYDYIKVVNCDGTGFEQNVHCSQTRNGLTSPPSYSPDSEENSQCSYADGFFYNYVLASWSPLTPECCTTTDIFAGPGWKIEYTHPDSVPCSPYFRSATYECSESLTKIMPVMQGWSGYCKIVVHIDQGVIPPTLAALGIPNPGPVVLGTGGETSSGAQPVAIIISPQDGEKFGTPANIEIKVFAFDSDNEPLQVNLYRGSTFIGTATHDSSGLYTFTWNNVPPGNYSLTAQAVDPESQVGTSEPVEITVSNIDPNFNANVNGAVFDAAVQADGKIVIVGDFSAVNGIARNKIARLNANGTLDTSFDGSGVMSSYFDLVDCVAVDSLHRVYVGGLGSSFPGILVRLDSEGGLDKRLSDNSDYVLNCNGEVLTMSGGGKEINVNPSYGAYFHVGGSFTTIDSVSNICIADIQIGSTSGADWGVDGSLLYDNIDPSYNGAVHTLAQMPNYALIAGGDIVSTYGDAWILNAGYNSTTPTFGGGADGYVYSLVAQPDGKLLVGGNFWTLNGESVSAFTRCNADGTVDLTFNSNADGQFGIVDCMLLQPDGKILASGDGGLKRFNSNGTLDSSFNVAVNGMIWKMVQQLDGKILIVGEFTSVGGQPHVKLARIGSTP